jgi:anthranilate phosphoribosyltransferase
MSTMNYSSIFKSLASTTDGFADLNEANSHAIYAALFDAGLPEMEVGAFIAYSNGRKSSLAQLLGLQRALTERVARLRPPQRELRLVLIPSYCGTVNQLNLTALVALLLQRYEIPVLLHGTLEGRGGVATAYVLRELNILPSASAQAVQSSLDRDLFAFAPTAALSPGLAQLLALRTRLGLSNQDYIAPTLLDPFAGQCVQLSNVADLKQTDVLRELYRSTGQTALMFIGTEGEPFVDPVRRPALELIADGASTILFDSENGQGHTASRMPRKVDLAATVKWIRQALAGEVAIPHPILNQLACCLFASGYTKDMHQAKAIAAMSAGGLVAA